MTMLDALFRRRAAQYARAPANLAKLIALLREMVLEGQRILSPYEFTLSDWAELFELLFNG
jgi:hypothetical protein